MLALPARSAEPKYVDCSLPENYWPKGTTIDWKDTWEATYKANCDRANAEIPNVPDGTRPRRLNLRIVRLLEEMLKHFPDKQPSDAVRRLNANIEMGERLMDSGLLDRGASIFRKLIDDSPGGTDLAVNLLTRILGKFPYADPNVIDEGPRWVEYASDRLIALNRAGVLGDNHSSVALALRHRLRLRRSLMHGFEAWQTLRDIEDLTGPDVWWRTQQAHLLLDIGRSADALRIYQDLASAPTANENGDIDGRIAMLTGPRIVPSFIHRASLEDQCARLPSRPLAEQIDLFLSIIRESADGQAMMSAGESGLTSAWTWADRALLSQPGKLLPALRAAQQQEAPRVVKALPAGETAAMPAHSLALYRRLPWAAASHQALIAAGESLLRQGHSALARRMFQDVLTHAADAPLRAQAQAGLWLTLLHESAAPEAVNEAFKGVSPDASFAWLGRMLPARTIQAQLLASPPAAPAPEPAVNLSAMPCRVVPLPPSGAWSTDQQWCFPNYVLPAPPAPAELLVCGPDLLVAGPRFLACYGPDLSSPRWTAAPRLSVTAPGLFSFDNEPHSSLPLPGPFIPAVSEGKVVARWGQTADGRYFEALAAFDLQTGRMLWSTAGMPSWQGLRLANDPVIAQDRLYLLATLNGAQQRLPVYLVCADADTGALLWKHLLLTNDHTITLESSGYCFDTLTRGSAVAVRDGAVYCAIGLGVLARCDARDGLVEWARTYPRPVRLTDGNVAKALRGRAGPPLLAGDKVIFRPRDYPGVLALDARTGKIAWDNPCVSGQEAILAEPAGPAGPATAPAAGGLLILKGNEELTAVEPATGRPVWHRRFDQPLLPGLTVCGPRSPGAGPAVMVASRTQAWQLAAATGIVVQQAPLGAPGPVLGCAFRNGQLECLTSASAARGASPSTPLSPAASEAPAFSLPARESWRIDHPNCEMIIPPPHAGLDGKMILRSTDVLECVTMGARGAIDWRLVLESGCQLAWSDRMLLAVYPRRVIAVNAASGAVLWETPSPILVNHHRVVGPYLFLGAFLPNGCGRPCAVIELGGGKLLWHGSFTDALGPDNFWAGFLHAAWDGQNVHLLSRGEVLPGFKGVDVVCRPADGKVLNVLPLPVPNDLGPIWGLSEKGWGLFGDQERRVYRFDFKDKLTAALHPVDLKPFDSFDVSLSDPWVFVSTYRQYAYQTLVLRGDDPSYQMVIPGRGWRAGDRFFAPVNGTVTVADLPGRKKITLTCPPLPADYGQPVEIVYAWEQGNSIFCLVGLNRVYYWNGVYPPAHLRLDVFDRAGGKLLTSQFMEGLAYWKQYGHRYADGLAPIRQTTAHFAGNVLYVVDHLGLHALVSAGGPAPPPPSSMPFAGPPPAITVDGSMDDWPEKFCRPLKDSTGQVTGKLGLTYDESALYIALACPGTVPAPRQGGGDFDGGTALELYLQAANDVYRCRIGLDDRGRTVLDGGEVGDFSKDVECVVRCDPLGGQLVYELAVPMSKARVAVWDGKAYVFAKTYLSLAGWDAGASCGAAPRFAWRGQLVGLGDLPKK